MALLWVEIVGICFGRESGSSLAIAIGMVPDIGGRFCDLGVIEEIKSPCGGRGLWGLGCKEIPKFS